MRDWEGAQASPFLLLRLHRAVTPLQWAAPEGGSRGGPVGHIGTGAVTEGPGSYGACHASMTHNAARRRAETPAARSIYIYIYKPLTLCKFFAVSSTYEGKMARKQSEDSFSEQENLRRLEAILRGAFAGPPIPLKDIPTSEGKARATRKDQRPRRRQRKKRAA